MASWSLSIRLGLPSLLFPGLLFFYSSCTKEYSTEKGPNKNPIANAGADLTIQLPLDSTILDGHASTDPDGTIASYLWTKISGPSSFIITDRSAAITLFKNLVVGLYALELKVTDNKASVSTDTLNINVIARPPGNRPPVAVAGADQTINLPSNTVILDGVNSTDPDNNILSYVWTRISGPGTFLFTNLTSTQVTANFLVAGTHQFELTVTDAGGLYSKDTVQITVH